MRLVEKRVDGEDEEKGREISCECDEGSAIIGGGTGVEAEGGWG